MPNIVKNNFSKKIFHLIKFYIVGYNIVDETNLLGSSTNFKGSEQSCFVLC